MGVATTRLAYINKHLEMLVYVKRRRRQAGYDHHQLPFYLPVSIIEGEEDAFIFIYGTQASLVCVESHLDVLGVTHLS